MGALDGIMVLDLSQQLPGPYATLLLAHLGAEVIKIEPPGGDAARELDERMFRAVNVGKRSLVLDLKSGGGRERLARLATGSDVLLEGFRPGTVERLGAGYATISALRPDIVYCSLSGFGLEGPYRDVPGHDLNYLGIAGGATERSESGEIGIPLVDLGSGTLAALAITSALLERNTTGSGRYLDIAMLDTAVFWAGVKAPPPRGSEPAYLVAAAADGLSVSIAVIEDKFWRNLCACLGWSDWREDPALATHELRRAHGEEIRTRLRAAIATLPRERWLAALWAADVPAAPVHTRVEVAGDPQVLARGLMPVASNGADAGALPPIPAAPLPAALRSGGLAAAPRLGQDTENLLAELDQA
jgi:crotonobetainyl-CoA:carnitine CoA-transferase CaiB-like acyl-CoA transferase